MCWSFGEQAFDHVLLTQSFQTKRFFEQITQPLPAGNLGAEDLKQTLYYQFLLFHGKYFLIQKNL